MSEVIINNNDWLKITHPPPEEGGSGQVVYVRIKNTNKWHDIYIPACKISEKLAEINETPYLLQTDFNSIVSINKRYKINSYSEEYFRQFYKEFKDSFWKIDDDDFLKLDEIIRDNFMNKRTTIKEINLYIKNQHIDLYKRIFNNSGDI